MSENKIILPDQASQEQKHVQVRKMFNSISGNYDKLNKVITFGMEKGWKKNVYNLVASKNPDKILDIATGTGDMLLLFANTKASEILGTDISEGMLAIAEEKVKELGLQDRINLDQQDAENLQLPDNHFDAISITYGIRNFENLDKCLKEIYRVTAPGGQFIVLETSVPENFVLKTGHLFYTKWIMPSLSRMFSKDKTAYKYLSESALNFPYGEALKKRFEMAGFKDVKILPQFFGASTIYVAVKG
jgi:demethylmenaquinone methyltransferase/2-methoxy-6-polyprenyl-1,4-benzoquinol methylase